MTDNSCKFTEIVIRQNNYFKFPKVEKLNGDILILGNFNGICGDAKWFGEYGQIAADNDFCYLEQTFFDNLSVILGTINNGGRIAIASSGNTIEYFKNLLYSACYWTLPDGISNNEARKKIKDMINRQVKVINTDEIYERTYVSFNYKGFRKYNAEERLNIFVNNLFKLFNGVKFDTIIQNPPFNGNLHLDFLEKGIELLKEDGKMTIIEPSSWLVDIRDNARDKKRYDSLKSKISGHVESVVIENFNNEFGTGLYVPFSIVTVDMSKTFDKVDFVCCGEHKKVKSIDDCNLIGDYSIVKSILDKVMSYGDMMESHVTNNPVSGDVWYTKCGKHLPKAACIISDPKNGFSYTSDAMYSKTKNGYFIQAYTDAGVSSSFNELSNQILKAVKRGSTIGEKSDKNADCVYGSKDDLENWRHFIFNNKLSLFINIVLSNNQDNRSKPYLPWLVDKQYTDDEIYKLFDFNKEEVSLINRTIKKFERNSPWFKRYACGPESVSDGEVNKFIKKLYEEC